MADDGVFVRVEGIPDLKAELLRLPEKLRKRALLNALRAGGRVVRDSARSLVPVLRVPIRRRGTTIRQPGTVKRAISVRTSKQARREGNVGVYVNVRPAKPGQRGADNSKDPYYWRWLEFGRQARAAAPTRVRIKGVRSRKARRGVAPMRAFRFLRGAGDKLPQALAVIIAKLGPAVQKILDKQASQ